MAKHPRYCVTSDYRGAYIVCGPDFAKVMPDFVTAHNLAKTLNDQHAKTQALASNVLAVHFPINVPKDIA